MYPFKSLLQTIFGLLTTLSVASYALVPLSFRSAPTYPVFVNAGCQSTVQYTLQNNTPVTLPLSISTSAEQGQLQVIQFGNTCGAQLAGNRSCTLPLQFSAPPTPNQSTRGQLTINYQGRYPLQDKRIQFRTNPQGQIVYTQNGQVITALTLTSSDSGTIFIKNRGKGMLQNLRVTIPSELSGFTSGCEGKTLAPWQSCPITYNNPTSSTTDPVLISTRAKNATQSPVKLRITIEEEVSKAVCWGFNSSGQLGNGTTLNSSIPVDVLNLDSNVLAMTGGANFVCALLDTDAIKCWGQNNRGQLGDGTTANSAVPVDVSSLGPGSDVIEISAGNFHTCALVNTGAVKCWGRNTSGQLGNGTTTDSSTPVDVSGLGSGSGVVAITTGGNLTCALLNTDAVKCWGSNNNGQIGDGTTTDRLTPVDVSGLGSGSGVIAITGGGVHTCALLNTGVKCWGLNSRGQLGNGTTMNSAVPVNVSSLSTGVTAITGGTDFTCAIVSGGVKCWGNNSSGQLGDGTTTNRLTPVDVFGLGSGSGVIAIMGGAFHTCALLNNGTVKCWGGNFAGELGNGTTTTSPIPVNVLNISTGTAILNHNLGRQSCAILSGSQDRDYLQLHR